MHSNHTVSEVIRTHYTRKERMMGFWLGTTALFNLITLIIGIMYIAYNWDNLSEEKRTVLSIIAAINAGTFIANTWLLLFFVMYVAPPLGR